MTKEEGIRGQGYEKANICADCSGPLRAPDGHWHTRAGYGGVGAEPICCKENPNCSGESLAGRGDQDVELGVISAQGRRKGVQRHQPIEATRETAIYQEFMEDSEMSKTSQKNASVSKAMAGQKEAKAAVKATKAPAEKKAKAEKAPKADYDFKPLPASFTGVAGKATMNGNILKNVPYHAVKDGKTACGYSTQKESKGLSTYELNWKPVEAKVSCGRCIKNLNKPVKAAAAETNGKKPTPITAAKSSKKKVKAAAK